jgi:Fe-S-cluster-containing dehydrogenase component
MLPDRRQFLKLSAAAAATALAGSSTPARAAQAAPDSLGCLVDTTLCVGCRQCEKACNQRNHLPAPKISFDETAVLENERRMDETTYTVVNKYYPRTSGHPHLAAAAHLCEVPVHALQRPLLRVGLHRGRSHQAA